MNGPGVIPVADNRPAPVSGHGLPRGGKPWFRALRPFSYPASLLPFVLAVTMTGVAAGRRWDLAAAGFVGVLLMHSMGNLLNDVFDHRYRVDTRVDDENRRPGRFLVKGIMVPRDIMLEAGVCALLLAPVAAYLLWQAGWPVLAFGAAGVGGGYAYTGPPFKFKYRAMGEATIFAVFGPLLMIGAAFIQTGRLEVPVMLVSVPVGMMVTAILAAGSLRDLDEERAARITTLSQILGRTGMKAMYLALLSLPPILIAGLVIGGFVTPWALMSLAVLMPGAILAKAAVRGAVPQDFDAQTARLALTPFVGLLIIAQIVAGGA
ncbi:MAG: prenyltransferase [Planctomycetota bacterium]